MAGRTDGDRQWATGRTLLTAVISPDIFGVCVVGLVMAWLIGAPFGRPILDYLSLLGTRHLSTSSGLVAMAILSLLAFHLIFRSRRSFTLLLIAFVSCRLLWSGVMHSRTQLSWWRLFQIDLPPPKFIDDDAASLFILVFGSWALVSLRRFRSLRERLRSDEATPGDIAKVSLLSTVLLVGGFLAFAGAAYFTFHRFAPAP